MTRKPPIVLNTKKVMTGTLLICLGWYFASGFTLIFSPFLWFFGFGYLASGLLLYPYRKKVDKTMTGLLAIVIMVVVLSLFSVGMGGVFSWVLFYLIAQLKLKLAVNKTRYQLKLNQLQHKQLQAQKPKVKHEFVADVQSLQFVLSSDVAHVLEKLVIELTNLQEHLGYLAQHHPYLATSVDELINDIRHNSLVRFDKTASTLLSKNKTIQRNNIATFVKTQQSNVIDVLQEHVNEVTALNQSILDKKMAEFEKVGTKQEKAYRDAIMELKILFRWHIAQQPENEVNRHQVLYKKLETSTLQEMQNVFYQADSTEAQKNRLVEQANELLDYFKDLFYRYEDDNQANNNMVLQLEYKPNQAMNQPKNAQTNAFLDFNEQYIKQLKKHWH